MPKEKDVVYMIIASIFTLFFIIFFFTIIITITGPDRNGVLGFIVPILLFLVFVWINLNNKKAIKMTLSIFSNIITFILICGFIGTIFEKGMIFIPIIFIAELFAAVISIIGLIVLLIEFLVLKNR